jgi:hypothetical protein
MGADLENLSGQSQVTLYQRPALSTYYSNVSRVKCEIVGLTQQQIDQDDGLSLILNV